MIKKILDKIKEADSIIIIGHVSPDGDCLGCQFGLKEIIKDTFNKEKVYAVGEDSVTLAYMGKLDTVTDKQFRESLVIFVDLANNERAADKRYTLAKEIIKIDHHFTSEVFGSLCYIDYKVSAAAEIIAEMLISFKKKISEKCAYYLYSAIVGDSGRFQYSDTSSRTFKIVSKLFESKFDFQEIYDKMYTK